MAKRRVLQRLTQESALHNPSRMQRFPTALSFSASRQREVLWFRSLAKDASLGPPSHSPEGGGRHPPGMALDLQLVVPGSGGGTTAGDLPAGVVCWRQHL